VRVKEIETGLFELGLEKGQEVVLTQDAGDQRPVVAPCVLPPESVNFFGIKVPKKSPPGALSTGKPAKASSQWGGGFEASMAFDGDERTRWGAAPNSRSGWLEVDLGQEMKIGRALIKELEFPRTQEFVIEYQDGEVWKELARGTTIAGEKMIEFAPVSARRVRLNILKANEVPTLEEFALYPK
jgi:hypothetical protein